MQEITDWKALWRELVEMRQQRHDARQGDNGDRGKRRDAWRDRARSFDKKVKDRWSEPDSSRTFIASILQPDSTVIDIGAGTGRWALFMARHAGQVTAVEPSESMIAVMRENIAEAGLDNIEIVQGAWPEADVAVHDYALCSHAMYGVADLSRFIERMNEVTRRTCFMLMRVPVLNGVMNVAAERVWGQPHDSPNFVIAYNVLLEMGIHANVLMEDTGAWGGWRHDTIDAALAGMKEKLGLQGPSPHDTFLRALLHERLSYDEEEDQWVWPPSVRSALVYWDVEQMD